ncbi:hypothetical protein [Herbiconiux sp. VKM Ac-2851]|uniref:hypothetical protein n=1 Tax=Herbiconiux sp. VKM Ac-2851 TaxID=2739025 RepID=UPI001564535D|nr:hypothetical protein [Herbiconiux sp. VKM Ac-2851]NQX37046.1 hypothetical protein [Herbiconiux sp. VKM Ac-2851]
MQAVALIWNVVVFDFDAYLAETVHSFERNGRELQVTPELAVATWVFGLAASALGIGLRAGFTLALRRGYNRVRIVLTILFAALLLPPYETNSIATVVLEVLIVVPALAGIVFIWLPESNAYFREVKRARVAHKAKEFG